MAGPTAIENRTALPLAEAAQRLGISVDALRKRWKRGKIEGRRNEDGRVFIYLDAGGQASGQASGQEGGQMSNETLDVIIELQSTELTRLLAENHRLVTETSQLNGRLDGMMELQKREQVLRQQMQNQLDGLQERLALPSSETLHLESRLNETEGNLSLLKQAMWKLAVFLESKRA